MSHRRWLLALMGMLLLLEPAQAGLLGQHKFKRVNMKLHGQVLDFTRNHGHDNRIYSPALCKYRDVYVYLPPGYSPDKKYPVGFFLHGNNQDEQFFIQKPVHLFDDAIACGELAPVIIVAPDGSIQGRTSFCCSTSCYANTRAGNFEDYLMYDVWNFAMENFSIHPDREAHALMGVSMGGAAAFANGIKHKDRVKLVVGFMPALNLRWVDCTGKYNRKFDPDCWGYREQVRPFEIIGRPGLGIVKIRFHTLLGPLVGHGSEAIDALSEINPMEVLERSGLKDKELDLYVAYGGKDEFNIDTQCESFLYRAREMGITVESDYDPDGRHNLKSGVKHFAGSIRWVSQLVAPYDVRRAEIRPDSENPAPDR